MRNLDKSLPFYLLLIMTFGLFSCFSAKETPQDLIFYYFESCPSCDEYILAEELSGKINNLNKKAKWDGTHYNLIVPQGVDRLKTTLKEKNLPDISRSLPLLIIGTDYINGYDAIETKLNELLTE
ncbi:hypothetical protein [Oceanispirochaeta sp.]|jgi:hypothetical protein|uniref:hypothetical protein n=1 Tax=Oceanispirochaeta sp. TaxID=2035350 RepID=UPI0026284573|nr:hypothetical protein [Oceanispirochaeta sp.]MDA3957395.1 hypothetical protein [Oceanispirochaeta sp.]